MARSHGVLKVSIWHDKDFTELSGGAQWAYLMLISQPEMSYVGIIPYLPQRWAGFAKGLNTKRVEEMVGELEAADYIILDRGHCELCVRSFIKHTQIWTQPNLIKNARGLTAFVKSEPVVRYLFGRYPWLFDNSSFQAVKDYELEHLSQKERVPGRVGGTPTVGLSRSEGIGISTLSTKSVVRPLSLAPGPDPVVKIYEHWRKTFGKTRASYDKISPERRSKILTRLKKFSEEELIRALDAAGRDDWDRRHEFCDFKHLFKSDEVVDRWLDSPSPALPTSTSTGQRYWQPGDPPMEQMSV